MSVAEAAAGRSGWHGLYAGAALLLYLDWHPARDGRYYAIVQEGYEQQEVWLKPDDELSEIQSSDLARR